MLLSAVNPKNLLLCVAAGTLIGSAGPGPGERVIALVVFTVIAVSTVPVVAYAVAADRMRDRWTSSAPGCKRTTPL